MILTRKTKLNELKIGQKGQLVLPKIPDSPELTRLKEMGFINGASIELLHKGPLGSPLLFDICHTRIGIRKEEASWFEVE